MQCKPRTYAAVAVKRFIWLLLFQFITDMDVGRLGLYPHKCKYHHIRLLSQVLPVGPPSTVKLGIINTRHLTLTYEKKGAGCGFRIVKKIQIKAT